MAVGIIPARYGSTRFPGKPLARIAGYPVIIHVLRAAQQAKTLENVYVATDDERIFNAVKESSGNAVMTGTNHKTGSDRIVEALQKIPAPEDDVVVNIQGDEPLIEPDVIDSCVSALHTNREASWATPIYPLKDSDQYASPQRVKVVCDENGFALYFSRAQIPFNRDADEDCNYFGHIGLYAYRLNALKKFAETAPTPLEKAEKLEQLRALEIGLRIKCIQTPHAWPGIDTPEDLAYVEETCSHLFTAHAQ